MPGPGVPQELDVEAVRSLARLTRILERSFDEISLAHYRVLSAIAGGDRRASRVSAKLALGKPSVSAAVDALCSRGLVSRAAGDDQRVVELDLTDAGRALLARVEAAMVARVRELCEHTPHGVALMAAFAALGPAIDETRAATVAS